MTTEFLYDFLVQHKYGVLATVSKNQLPESAVVGIAVTQDLKIIFDTVSDSRKYENLLSNPHIAFAIGWDHEQTIQYEGIARLMDPEREVEYLHRYFEVFPDGMDRKEHWKNIVYFCVEPKWVRYSDFSDPAGPVIEEIKFVKPF